MKLSALALPRRVSLAVVARDASNPSTGLFAKQQVAGRLGLEPRPTVLETAMLPLHHQPMVTGCLRVLALAFTLMAVLATYAPLSFPPVWSGLLDLNQTSLAYQASVLTY